MSQTVCCSEHLNQEIARQRWDQIRIILQQPYARNKQMGIEHIRLSNKLESAENVQGNFHLNAVQISQAFDFNN